MGVFPIGRTRLGIVTDVPQLDGDDQPVLSEFKEPQYMDPDVALVDGCQFEVQTMSQVHGLTVVTTEAAHAVLPVADGQVPLVDEDGNRAGSKSVSELTSKVRLRDFATGRDYRLNTDASLNVDIRGRQDHVEIACTREQA